MAGPGSFLFVSLCVLGFFHVETKPDTLSSEDSSFCYGGLKVIYPELDIDKCIKIPETQNLRKKISTVWGAPQISFSGAHADKKYILVMVDPDAPKPSKPTSAHWRHWLVVDIKGGKLKTGQLDGITLTDYFPPKPPQGTGFHRYQFLLFEQPPRSSVSLTDEEKPRGKWDLDDFIMRFDLGKPKAILQFLTQNFND